MMISTYRGFSKAMLTALRMYMTAFSNCSYNANKLINQHTYTISKTNVKEESSVNRQSIWGQVHFVISMRVSRSSKTHYQFTNKINRSILFYLIQASAGTGTGKRITYVGYLNRYWLSSIVIPLIKLKSTVKLEHTKPQTVQKPT